MQHLHIINIYDQIREVQNASFKKYGDYSHVAGALGVWLEAAFYNLPSKQQQLMHERLNNMLAELKQ